MESAALPTTEGERLKHRAHSLLAARREVYVRRGRRALLTRLLAAADATADHVRAVVVLPAEINPKCFGAVPGPLAEAGIIRADGFRRTARRESHARPVQVWTLADRGAALAWLANHPDMPDADAGEPDGFAQPTLY